jgi:hypothetical protein
MWSWAQFGTSEKTITGIEASTRDPQVALKESTGAQRILGPTGSSVTLARRFYEKATRLTH